PQPRVRGLGTHVRRDGRVARDPERSGDRRADQPRETEQQPRDRAPCEPAAHAVAGLARATASRMARPTSTATRSALYSAEPLLSVSGSATVAAASPAERSTAGS